MTRPTCVGMSEDMKTAFRELVEMLVDEKYEPDAIVDLLSRCIDPKTEFFAELSTLIMDSSLS